MPAVENSDMRTIELVGGAGEEIAIPIANIDQLVGCVMHSVDKDLRADRVCHTAGAPDIVDCAESVRCCANRDQFRACG